jgi:hypothetical protein
MVLLLSRASSPIGYRRVSTYRCVLISEATSIGDGGSCLCAAIAVGSLASGPARGQSQSGLNKLLEGIHVERLDTGAKGSTGGIDQDLAAVGALNRPKKRSR